VSGDGEMGKRSRPVVNTMYKSNNTRKRRRCNIVGIGLYTAKRRKKWERERE
jgi:hypothetical protein